MTEPPSPGASSPPPPPASPPAPPPSQADLSRERIVAAATELFAEHGYDGTTTRTIAAAAGLNVATVAYHVGGKADLYREVMRRAHEAERAAVAAALGEFAGRAGADPAGAAAGFADRYLDFCLERPDVPALWMRRWLADAAEFAGLEEEYARPLLESVRDALAAALPGVPPERAELAVWTVLWTVHGFCRSMIRAQVPRFRVHLRGLVLRELGLGAGS
ncbi:MULTISPECIES: TetR/AcrR family transcriptional regulator [Kitasatospora]|uniref:Putative TetR family transcriptional regulator n=1 Tax=Kitasatospora setae (strain ATCC 33774 / DSM 43861 / JCM 3304 / KCC A-0304 / NBRC 14216 / KM-6054) TaxID=452652 RepID=E4NA88_KITSK|nr:MULTISPECIES: TetR/AcrR family transcriptional regulator [Kitasatospora]BAJ28119.1 putative TetR family transcriptional regulator [Kitasatospora setae KM-6054]